MTEQEKNIHDLLDLAYKERHQSDYESADKLIRRGLELAEKAGLKLLIGKAHILSGHLHMYKVDYWASIREYKAALEYLEVGDPGYLTARMGVANCENYLENTDKAVEEYHNLLKAAEKAGNKKTVASAYNNLSQLYKDLDKLDLALEYAERAVESFEELGEEPLIARSYAALGNIYLNLLETEKGIDYNKRAIKIRRKIGDEYSLARALMNLGVAYIDLKDFNNAETSLLEALSLAQKSGNKLTEAFANQKLGILYTKQNRCELSLEHLFRTRDYCVENNLKSLYRATLIEVVESYECLGDNVSALGTLKEYMRLKTEDFKERLSKRTDELIAKFETEKKEIEAEKANLLLKLETAKTQELEKANQLVQDRNRTIESLNRGLEDKVKDRTRTLKGILDNIEDPLFFIYQNGKATFNIAAGKLMDITGIENPEDIEKSLDKQEIFQPLDSRRSAILGEQSSPFKAHRRRKPLLSLVLKDETVAFFDVFLSDIVRDDGEKLGRLIHLRDITSMYNAWERLEKSQSMLDNEHRMMQSKNIALREVLMHIEEEKLRIKQGISQNISNLILPTLEQLRTISKGRSKVLTEALATELRNIMEPSERLLSSYSRLSRREIEISNMIRNGLSSKEIARNLGLVPETVNRHRNRIREKLGLVGKSSSLRNFLLDSL